MELSNEFTVQVPIEQAWATFTDVERIAPCLPGAELREVDGDEYRGVVKVKVGPITAEYKGKATFLERDAETRRIVLRAEGRDTRGQGNASAMVTATLEPAGHATRVGVVTDLMVSGRVAQFGRGVLADVNSKLMSQFVSSLEATLEATPPSDGSGEVGAAAQPAGATEAGGAGEAAASGTAAAPPETSLNLVRMLGPSLLKRALPILGAVIGAFVVQLVRRRRSRTAG